MIVGCGGGGMIRVWRWGNDSRGGGKIVGCRGGGMIVGCGGGGMIGCGGGLIVS